MPSAEAGGNFDRGRHIGKYEILTRLSLGGMAELYLAFLPGPGGFKKFVAVKQILPDVKRDEAFVKMFLDEARITAAFNHANIGQVFDLGEDQEELYLAMEFIAGQNLQQVIQRAAKTQTPIPVGFAARVIRDTCLGLHYAHQFRDPASGQPLPVIHRDVSPKNIMIAYAGDVKVIDFGIAKARGRLNRTNVGIVKGTSGYMAPEQVKNAPLDGRTDLFAAAVILHELLTGERLFSAPTDVAMMLAIADAAAPDPSMANAAVSAQFSQVILKALSKTPAQRFATGRELARAIEQSCPALFDEEQTGQFVSELFADKVTLTRSLLDLANSAQADEVRMTKAVQKLVLDEAENTGSGRVKRASTKLPASRRESVSSLPRVEGARNPSARSLPKVASSQSLPKVATDSKMVKAESRAGPSHRSLPKVSQPADDLDKTIPPQSLRYDKAAPIAPLATPPNVALPKARSRLKSALFFVLVSGALLASGVLLFTKTSIQDKLNALWNEGQIEVADPNAPIAQVDLSQQQAGTSAKPQWLIEQERVKAQQQKDKEELSRLEALQNTPERLQALSEIKEELSRIYKMEEEQRLLKIEAAKGSSAGAANSKRIDELQAQIEELRAVVGAKQNKVSAKAAPAAAVNTPAPSDDVTLVTDAKGAAAASIGYLTLSTVRPSKSAVLQNGVQLEVTPFKKMPLPEGTHILYLLDGDSRSHRLLVRILKGKATEYANVDVNALPLVEQ